MGRREGEEKSRNEMMQNLFGDQSEYEDEDDEADSAPRFAAKRSDSPSDEGEGEVEIDAEGEGKGQGEAEVESEAEADNIEVESEGERVQSSPEREIGDQRIESEGESEKDGYGQRAVTGRRREVIASESEGSGDNHYGHDNVDGADKVRKPRSLGEQKDQEVVRDVFGDSDEDEPGYGAQNEVERSPIEEEGSYEKDFRPKDIVPDEDKSEDDKFDQKPKEKPVAPPLELEIPLHPRPSQPDKMNTIKISNIMGIESKPFVPEKYVEEDVFVTDELGAKKRIRLKDNIVRWRSVQKHDDTTSRESNARFVKWSDGSLQLLIGNEVLDISVQETNHENTHLFLRHRKGILQSQGRLLQKMRFMPSSLSSKSHRLLTALVDSRHKKVYKVKNCITNIDPEREKEEKEKVEGQSIRANALLHLKREKVNHKYSQTVNRVRQLSPGFLEDALDEDDEPEGCNSSRRASARHRFEADLEVEAEAEMRIVKAKRPQVNKNAPRKPPASSAHSSRRSVEEYSESEREVSECEIDVERSPQDAREDEPDFEEEFEEEDPDEAGGVNSASEEEEPTRKVKESLKRKEIELDDEDSPPTQMINRRKSIISDSEDD